MRREDLPPHWTASYVLPDWKVVYVAIPKAACTSIKWLIAALQRESAEEFHAALSREVIRSTTIHHRRLWRNTPMLHRLEDAELEAIGPEDGWFVFGTVRHPSSRLWSAWQSKFLLREPRWLSRFGDEPWLPRVPTTSAEVVEDFQRFVRAVAEDPAQPVLRDRHFQAQSRLLTPERTPYTRIYRMSELGELLDDLGAHLGAQGWTENLELADSNETPLRPLATMFTPEIEEAVFSLYQEDFERFRYEEVAPDNLHPEPEYGVARLAEIRRLVQRAERVGDLAGRAQKLAALANAREKELEGLRPEVSRLRRDVDKLQQDVTRLRTAANRRLSVRVKRKVRQLLRRLASLGVRVPGRQGDGQLVSTAKTARQ